MKNKNTKALESFGINEYQNQYSCEVYDFNNLILWTVFPFYRNEFWVVKSLRKSTTSSRNSKKHFFIRYNFPQNPFQYISLFYVRILGSEK